MDAALGSRCFVFGLRPNVMEVCNAMREDRDVQVRWVDSGIALVAVAALPAAWQAKLTEVDGLRLATSASAHQEMSHSHRVGSREPQVGVVGADCCKDYAGVMSATVVVPPMELRSLHHCGVDGTIAQMKTACRASDWSSLDTQGHLEIVTAQEAYGHVETEAYPLKLVLWIHWSINLHLGCLSALLERWAQTPVP